jgi:very-short-patch-repair endonuclease
MQEADALRTQFLQENGIVVFRIPNNAIWENLRGVCEAIDEIVKKRL